MLKAFITNVGRRASPQFVRQARGIASVDPLWPEEDVFVTKVERRETTIKVSSRWGKPDCDEATFDRAMYLIDNMDSTELVEQLHASGAKDVFELAEKCTPGKGLGVSKGGNLA